MLKKAPHNKIEYDVPAERQMKPADEGGDCSNDETVPMRNKLARLCDRSPLRFYLHNKLCNNRNLLNASKNKLLVTMRKKKDKPLKCHYGQIFTS